MSETLYRITGTNLEEPSIAITFLIALAVMVVITVGHELTVEFVKRTLRNK